jgi:hypothetical protein
VIADREEDDSSHNGYSHSHTVTMSYLRVGVTVRDMLDINLGSERSRACITQRLL